MDPKPNKPTPPFPVEPVPPELIEWARQNTNVEEVMAEIEEIRRTGGVTHEELMRRLVQQADGH